MNPRPDTWLDGVCIMLAVPLAFTIPAFILWMLT